MTAPISPALPLANMDLPSEAGHTDHSHRMGSLLKVFAETGKTLEWCTHPTVLNRRPRTLQHYCREHGISFPDFKPRSAACQAFKALTPGAQETYSYLLEFQSSRGYPPHLKEISAHFGFRSRSTARRYILQLEAAGFVRRVGTGRGQTLDIVKDRQGRAVSLFRPAKPRYFVWDNATQSLVPFRETA